MVNDSFKLGRLQLESRLILGTGKYADFEIMQKCHSAAETEMVTVALRRVNLSSGGMLKPRRNIIDFIDTEKITLLPNTAGAHSAEEALRLARIARSMNLTHLKVEVMGDVKTLLPDPIETYKAVSLIREEFSSDELYLMVYTGDDPLSAMRLIEAGADCIMPAGSPIGSGRGVQNPHNFRLMQNLIAGSVPLIIDAGIGRPSDAAFAMELGADAVLLNSAVANAGDPVVMAGAMKKAVEAGRASFIAGAIEPKLYGTASSPELNF